MHRKTQFITAVEGLKAHPVVIDGDSVLSQIHPQLRGRISTHNRDTDIRLILQTAPLGGQVYSFPNHGQPDNKMSDIPFDGKKAVMVIPTGETSCKKIFSAMQIIDHLHRRGLSHVTPDFMEEHFANNKGISRKFAEQVYGPTSFSEQAKRLVDVRIPGIYGGTKTIRPVIGEGYALGKRPSAKEEAFLVIYMSAAENIFFKGEQNTAALLSKMNDALSVRMHGTNTALEALDDLNSLTKAIVLAVDSVSGETKPIRLQAAREIFPIHHMNWILVNDKGQVTDQRLRVSASTLFLK